MALPEKLGAAASLIYDGTLVRQPELLHTSWKSERFRSLDSGYFQ